MIENFLRPPGTYLDLAADLLRTVGVLSVFLAAVFFEPTDAGIVAFTLPGLVAPRFLGMKPWADITVVGTLLVAAWSNVFDVYTRVPWWDLVVHLAGTGVIAASLYALLVYAKIVPDPRAAAFTKAAAVVLTTTLGLAVSALWEMVEWFGRAFVSEDIFIAYDDTIADMAMGGLGALCAGVVLAHVPLLRGTRPKPGPGPRQDTAPRQDPARRSDLLRGPAKSPRDVID